VGAKAGDGKDRGEGAWTLGLDSSRDNGVTVSDDISDKGDDI
jgi:hypothetical protein